MHILTPICGAFTAFSYSQLHTGMLYFYRRDAARTGVIQAQFCSGAATKMCMSLNDMLCMLSTCSGGALVWVSRDHGCFPCCRTPRAAG